jgi:hypothetical protein
VIAAVMTREGKGQVEWLIILLLCLSP